MLAFLVLCNAYRGENIETLSKSFEILPLTKLSHLLESPYTIYTKLVLILNRQTFFSYILANDSDEFTVYNELTYESKEYESLVNHDQLSAWNSSFKPHKDGLEFAYGGEYAAGFEIIKNCNNIALSGWKSELLLMEKELTEFKPNTTKIFIGEEYLFKTYSGMHIYLYGYQKYRQHIWTLFESGVYNLLVNASNKPTIPIQSEPTAINLSGNIIIQFIVLSIGLAGSALLLLYETTDFTQFIKPFGKIKRAIKLLQKRASPLNLRSKKCKIVKDGFIYFKCLLIRVSRSLWRSTKCSLH